MIQTPLCKRLGIKHPIMLAGMAAVYVTIARAQHNWQCLLATQSYIKTIQRRKSQSDVSSGSCWYTLFNASQHGGSYPEKSCTTQ